MSFYLRKSIKAGPFRVNLSKSGIGVSTGVRGLRVGTGPRGTYVRMGRDGVYYRQTLSSPGTARTAIDTGRVPVVPPVDASSEVILESVTGATTYELSHASSSDLVQQINEAAGRMSLLPLAVLLCLPVVTVPLAVWLYAKDKARRTVVAFYDVNDGPAARFEALVSAFSAMQGCSIHWYITARGDLYGTHQVKIHAGARSLLDRSRGEANLMGPSPLVTNIAVPSLHARTRSIYFLPDRILVRDGKRYADVSYEVCRAVGLPRDFVEEGPVPPDGKQIGYTWKYVNKGGGPDRRFKNNRQLPIMQYGELVLSATSGFRFTWQASQGDAVTMIARAISTMRADYLMPMN